MNAVVAAPTDVTELAPVVPAKDAVRGPSVDFNLLMALLQATLAPSPGPVAGTLAPDARDAAPELAADKAATPATPATPALAGLTLTAPLRPSRAVSPDAPVDPSTDDDTRAPQPAAMPASLIATVAMAPAMPAVLEPVRTTSAAEGVDLTSPIAQRTGPTLGDGTPTAGAVQVDVAPEAVVSPQVAASPQATRAIVAEDLVARSPLGAAQAVEPAGTSAGTPTATPTATPALALTDVTSQAEVQIARLSPTAVEPRPRPVTSARDVDALRSRDGAAAQESAGEGVPGLGAVMSQRVMRAAPGRDDLPGHQGRASSDGEAFTPTSDGTISGPAAPAPSMTVRPALDAVASARPATTPDPVDQIAMRLREVRTEGRHEISLRLDPPDLGAVRIDARLEGTRLHVQIRAEQASTGEVLTDALPRLREALTQQGFQPSEVSVHLGLDASGRQFARDDAPTFTPPPDGEPSPRPRVVPAAARAAAPSDGLDVWA